MGSRCLSRRKSEPLHSHLWALAASLLAPEHLPEAVGPCLLELRAGWGPGSRGRPRCRLGGHLPPSGLSGAASVDVGQDSVRHAPAVLVPGQAVLPQALLLVPGLPVHQQCREVEEVEVGQQVRHSCGEVEAVTAQQLPSSQRFPHRMAHRDTGAPVKGPGLQQGAGSTRLAGRSAPSHSLSPFPAP